jgi:transcription initiation factor TFIID subunit 2
MDLSTMRAKLENGGYEDRFAFEADFRLMIRNAKTYNGADSFVYKETVTLETFFEQRKQFLFSFVYFGLLIKCNRMDKNE